MLQIHRLKRMALALSIVLVLSTILAACGRTSSALESGKVNIVTSFYPLYDFSKKIGGSHVNVINLVPTGVEPHDWAPKSRDMQNLTNAEMFVYLGAGFEGWVPDTLTSLSKDSKVHVVEASKGVTLISGEEAGAQAGHADEHKDEHSEHGNVDPHVWLSPVNAKQMALNIKNTLVQTDAAHQADYEANYKKLADQLDALHNKFQSQLSQTKKKEIVVTHQSFGYLAKDYGLTQKALMGLSPDAEPTSKEMQEISQFVRDNGVKYIFFEELVSDKLAKSLAKDTGVETLVLNPIEGLTEEQMKAGADYVSVMENNLNNLVKALQ